MRIQSSLHRIFSVLPIAISTALYATTASGTNCGSQGPCPSVTLPWGTWQANSYTKIEKAEFFTFQNIRFGQAPTGNLRFARSIRPDSITDPKTPQNNTYGPSCIAIDPKELKKATGGNRFNLGKGTPYYQPDPDQDEDCLFLDVYVPKSALDAASRGVKPNVPVVVWFYGGAYVFGSKQVPITQGILYSGTGFLHLAAQFDKEMIFVAGNYRLGAFGWLAGSYMEANGTPNAGLTDQQLLLQWVYDFIDRFGGDKTQVSAWGESAGGGSIMHHLIANGGKRDPLFQKVMLQSPAYFWAWDRSGALNNIYQEFARKVDCPSNDIACLRAVNSSALGKANFDTIVAHAKLGQMPFGPAVDGTLIQHLPAVEFQNKNFWPNISSLMLSHVTREANMFIPKFINQKKLVAFINDAFPGQPEIVNQILNGPIYPAEQYLKPRRRLIEIARDAFFTGNLLQLYNAYQPAGKKVYITEYSWPYAIYARHAQDLFPTFYYPGAPLKQVLKSLNVTLPELPAMMIDYFSPRYQQYLVSHAITGDPNQFKVGQKHYQWMTATYDAHDTLEQVAQSTLNNCLSGPCFNSIIDKTLSRKRYEFWAGIASRLTPISSTHEPQPQRLLGFRDELK